MTITCLPQATYLKVQTSYHDAFKAELEREVPWQARRWEKHQEEGWIIWVREDYLPLLRRLAYWFDQAVYLDESAQQGQDLHSGRTWPLVPRAEQLSLFS
jgi:hypothetical protein